MRFYKLSILIILIVSATVLMGCGGEKKATTQQPGGISQNAAPVMPKIDLGTPQAAYKDMADAVISFDGAKLYDLLSTASKAQLDGMLANLKKETTFASSPYANTKTGAELLAKQFEIYKQEGGHGLDAIYKDQSFLANAINDCKITGDKATITEPNGGLVTLVKENGAWKVDLPANLLISVPPKPVLPKGTVGTR